ncbi:biotin/lipoyl-binding protein [Limnoraphis robusta]|uniref:Biotin/lipoyl-binding protein n=1 Tax=Limnoraphis robusta CCNP1315 TaxID=3110306 RepID=A0ABU5TXS7_9CYAN|nr:biotin/lipoyl-binding protein [Limnoraphis robusta]MEA5519634.1 biotin/lipoyl-binding protein [Limnoraphis robusta CCNP1315]
MPNRAVMLALFVAVALASAGGPSPADAADGLGTRLRALWSRLSGNGLPADIVVTNGRIEAEQVLVSAKFAGRVTEVLVEEGDTVEAGAVVARMDTAELDAQLAGAEAEVRSA